MDNSQFKLCFIKDNEAFFTTLPVTEQWGDDFNDAPYSCNAGEPYEPSVHYYANGEQRLSPRDWNFDKTPKWQLVTLKYSKGSVQIDEPGDVYGSSMSVEAMNAGAAPWLSASVWNPTAKDYEKTADLMAGATIDEFIQFIETNGGIVWVPRHGLHTTVRPQPRQTLEFAELT